MNLYEALKDALGNEGVETLGITESGETVSTLLEDKLVSRSLEMNDFLSDRRAAGVALETEMPPEWAPLMLECEREDAPSTAPNQHEDVTVAMGQYGLLQDRLGLNEMELGIDDDGDTIVLALSDGSDMVYWDGQSFHPSRAKAKNFKNEKAAAAAAKKANAVVSKLMGEAADDLEEKAYSGKKLFETILKMLKRNGFAGDSRSVRYWLSNPEPMDDGVYYGGMIRDDLDKDEAKKALSVLNKIAKTLGFKKDHSDQTSSSWSNSDGSTLQFTSEDENLEVITFSRGKAIGEAMSKKAFVKSVMAKYKGRSIDPNEYPPIKGMEGPFSFRKAGILYYDPKEGLYYDRKKDMYLDRDATVEAELEERGNPYHAKPDPSAPAGSKERRGGYFTSKDKVGREKGSLSLKDHPKSKRKVVGIGKKGLKLKSTPQDCGREARAKGEDVLCWSGKTKSGESGSKRARQQRASRKAGRVGRNWRKGRTDKVVGREIRRKQESFDAPDNMMEGVNLDSAVKSNEKKILAIVKKHAQSAQNKYHGGGKVRVGKLMKSGKKWVVGVDDPSGEGGTDYTVTLGKIGGDLKLSIHDRGSVAGRITIESFGALDNMMEARSRALARRFARKDDRKSPHSRTELASPWTGKKPAWMEDVAKEFRVDVMETRDGWVFTGPGMAMNRLKSSLLESSLSIESWWKKDDMFVMPKGNSHAKWQLEADLEEAAYTGMKLVNTIAKMFARNGLKDNTGERAKVGKYGISKQLHYWDVKSDDDWEKYESDLLKLVKTAEKISKTLGFKKDTTVARYYPFGYDAIRDDGVKIEFYGSDGGFKVTVHGENWQESEDLLTMDDLYMEAPKEPDHPKWKKRQQKGFDADGDGKTNEPMPAKLKKALMKESASELRQIEKLVNKRVVSKVRRAGGAVAFFADDGPELEYKDGKWYEVNEIGKKIDIQFADAKRLAKSLGESDETDFAGPRWVKASDASPIEKLRALVK